jgi:5'-methylthioadenosine phosphorylase
MVTDYDCWHNEHDNVTVESVVKIMQANSAKAKSLVKAVIPALGGAARPHCHAGCDRALEYAVITAPEKRDPELIAKLKTVAGRVL